jgi:hypothetical protein
MNEVQALHLNFRQTPQLLVPLLVRMQQTRHVPVRRPNLLGRRAAPQTQLLVVVH